MVTVLAASNPPLGHHFGAFAAFLIAVVVGSLTWALRDGSRRGARDADQNPPARVASHAGYQAKHRAKLQPPSASAARVPVVDDAPTTVLVRDGRWIA